MPRVKELRTNYMKTDARKMFKGKMAENDITQSKMGEIIGLSQSAFSVRFKSFDFTFEELVKMFNYLGLSNEEILKIMKM